MLASVAVSVAVCVMKYMLKCRARSHRVHLPTLGLDGQVYVCMCMGRYSV